MPARTIAGTFVEIDRNDWAKVAKSPKVGEIVIANIMGFDKSACQKGCDKSAQAIALIEAARPGMRIYVGLRYDANFSIATADGAKESVLAHAFYKKLTPDQKKRIAGWYLAGEWHNSAAAGYQKKVIEYLKAATVTNPLPPGEVLVAPFFVIRTTNCGDVLDAKATATMFKAILAQSRVTRLLLQDGFGARNERTCKWGDDIDSYQKHAASYVKEISTNMPENAGIPKKKKVVFGVDLEAFGDLGKDQCRLNVQFATVPQGAPVIVYEHRACCVTGLCQ